MQKNFAVVTHIRTEVFKSSLDLEPSFAEPLVEILKRYGKPELTRQDLDFVRGIVAAGTVPTSERLLIMMEQLQRR